MAGEKPKLEEKKVKEYSEKINTIKKEISKMVVGQNEVIERLFIGLLSNGHVLIEGVPGVAKTLLIRTLAKTVGSQFNRIQFTVDLLPTDITGITSYNAETKEFFVVKGPVFANFLLADEINRAPPKTQSAMLEVMAERQCTIGKETFPVPDPFFVLATQNPIETAGTYNLPEAQIDRFLLKVFMPYPKPDEEKRILDQNINIHKFDDFDVNPVIQAKEIIEMQEDVKKVYLNEKIEDYIVKIVDATRNPSNYKIKLGQYIEWGCSPRASIGLFIASKAAALINGRTYVTPNDVKEVALPVMRHRLIPNYEGMAEGIKTDDIIKEILKKIPVS
ncbi:MAG: MoxR family ATPase [Candidatus Aenigmarchaeota archaeon]|nr:MoxR family ATPase [Candidatus Aenigmarchaeota archaeon]